MGHKKRTADGLSPEDLALLAQLSPYTGLTANELAKAVKKTAGAVNQGLRKLRAAGYAKTTGRGSVLLWLRSVSAGPLLRAKFRDPPTEVLPFHTGVFSGGATPSNDIERSTKEVRRRHRIAKLAQEARELNIHMLRYEAGTDRFYITYRTTEIFKGPQTP